MAMLELFGEEGGGAVDGDIFTRRECRSDGTGSGERERGRMDPQAKDAVRRVRFLGRVLGRLDVHMPDPFLVVGRMGMDGR